MNNEFESLSETVTQGEFFSRFRAALSAGEPVFLWGPPGESVLLAVGEGTAGLRIGALGFTANPARLWRPREVASALIPRPDALITASDAAQRPPADGGTARTDWARRAKAASVAIRHGDLEKVVLARTETVCEPSGRPFDPWEVWSRLRLANPRATAFAVTWAEGCFLGATPELLASVNNSVVRTEAVAGTATAGPNAISDLQAPKEQAEHRLVVDALVEALEPYTEPGTLARPRAPEVLVLPRVSHLRTPISARLLPGIGLLEVALALHPTPAVCGTPRAAALAFLAEHEGLNRGAYAGPVGFVDDGGNGVFMVGLRCAWIQGPNATLYAGAGLVSGSRADAEFRETELKLQTVAEGLSPC